MEEVWKDIIGYEGLYQISSLGRVKSLDRWVAHKGLVRPIFRRIYKGCILKPKTNKAGYLCVRVSKEGAPAHFTVHRLVALAFISNPKNKPQVNHINGVKKDNMVENLEWATANENQQHASDTGLRVNAKGAENYRSIPVSQFTLKDVWVRDWAAAKEAQREAGFRQGNISLCAKGKIKSAGGFIWKFT